MKIIFSLLLCMLLLQQASAVPPLYLNENLSSGLSLQNNMEIFLDPTNTLTFADILSPEIQAQFVPYNFKTGANRYVLPNVTAWTRIKIINPYNYSVSIILRCWFDYNDIYMYEPDLKGNYTRENSDGFFYWVRLLSFNPHETKTVYMVGLNYRLYLYTWTALNFKSYDQRGLEEFFVLGGFLGIAIGLIFYNLFLLISTRDKNYLYYIITWVSFVIYKLLEASVITRYFIPSLSTYYNWVIRDIFVTLSVNMFVVYINSIVKSSFYHPWLQKISNVWLIASWITYVWYIYVRGVEPQHAIYLLTLTFGLILASVIVTLSMLDGYRPARYLFVGVISLLSAALTHVTLELIYLRNPYILFIFPIATSLEMVLQSLALADRYNLIKENEERIKKELILSQKKSLQQQSLTINSYERFLPKQMLPLLHKENFLQVNLADNVEAHLTVLFSDIRGFTQLSEKMSPQESFNFINNYLAHMAPIISNEKGIIDKYIGDAIMALFPTDADSAVRAALKLIMEIGKINRDSKHSINIGVAIHYGQLILGVIGSQERMECTVISDAVNVASRLESMNKTYGISLIISDVALSQCQQADQYHTRILDKVRFYGKGMANVVYEIFGYKHYILNEKLKNIVEFFELGISFYQNKDFVNALQQFRKCLKLYPEDKPSQFYVERCTDCLVHGTPPHWDGVFNIEK